MASDTNSKATAAEKRKQALDLRRAGWTFEDIANEVGYANKGSAHRAVKQGIADITRESATELVELELARLDDMLAGMYEKARDGDLWAVDRVLKIMEQRAKFLNLYDRQPEDPTANVRGALLDFAAGLKGLFGPDDTYGQVTDDSPSAEDVPSDSEPGS
jgi:hypothetical protein